MKQLSILDEGQALATEGLERAEIWKPIPINLPGIEAYEASSFGNIRSLWRKRIGYKTTYRVRVLLNTCNSDGYPHINVGKSKLKVHRLVAITFIPNPENKPTVNHKNGVRNDNRVENLEWATLSEQQKHAYKYLNKQPSCLGRSGSKHPTSKSVYCITNGQTYGSIKEAARVLKTHDAAILRQMKGKVTHAGGFKFRLTESVNAWEKL